MEIVKSKEMKVGDRGGGGEGGRDESKRSRRQLTKETKKENRYVQRTIIEERRGRKTQVEGGNREGRGGRGTATTKPFFPMSFIVH